MQSRYFFYMSAGGRVCCTCSRRGEKRHLRRSVGESWFKLKRAAGIKASLQDHQWEWSPLDMSVSCYCEQIWDDRFAKEASEALRMFRKHPGISSQVSVLSVLSSWDWHTCSPGAFQHQKEWMMKYLRALLTLAQRGIHEQQHDDFKSRSLWQCFIFQSFPTDTSRA